MTDWLGLPPLASAHGGQIDSLIGWMHVFMLILFVGWGGFFTLLPDPFPAIAASGGELHGRQVAHVELSRGRRGRGRSGSPVRIRDPALGREGRSHAPGERSAGRSGHRRAVRLERPLCRPRRGIRPHGHQAARPPVEPPGTRSLRSGREGRRHDAQSALSAREQADHREAQEQGRHPQLRRARVSREAGRHPRPHDPHLVRPHRHDRGDADPDGECPSSSTRLPARSSAVWAIPGCGDSSPSRPPRSSRSGWTKRSRSRPHRTRSGKLPAAAASRQRSG